MHPLLGVGSLVAVVAVSALLLRGLDRVSSWSRRRDLECVILAAPLLSLGISVAGLHFGASNLCFLGPLPLDYRVNVAVAFGLGLVAVAGLAAGVARVLLFKRTVARRGRTADPALQLLVRRLAGQFGVTSPRVLVCSHDRPLALTYGVRVPTLLLSSWMVEQLDAEELAAVVAHELGHVVRRDYLVAWLATVLRDAFCYLPTSRLAHQRLQQDKEPACDDLAVQTTARPLALASALAKVWHHAAGGPVLGPAQALTAVHESMEGRITRMLTAQPSVTRSAVQHWRALSVGTTALGALVVLELVNAAVLFSPMGCGSAVPLGKLF